MEFWEMVLTILCESFITLIVALIAVGLFIVILFGITWLISFWRKEIKEIKQSKGK